MLSFLLLAVLLFEVQAGYINGRKCIAFRAGLNSKWNGVWSSKSLFMVRTEHLLRGSLDFIYPSCFLLLLFEVQAGFEIGKNRVASLAGLNSKLDQGIALQSRKPILTPLLLG